MTYASLVFSVLTAEPSRVPSLVWKPSRATSWINPSAAFSRYDAHVVAQQIWKKSSLGREYDEKSGPVKSDVLTQDVRYVSPIYKVLLAEVET
jgi:hypothetical protein